MRRLPLLLAALVPLASGCVGYHMEPAPLAGPPFSKEPPVPLRVAVVEEPNAHGWGFRRIDEADSRKLTERLRYSGLFREVVAMTPPGPPPNANFDVVVNWKLGVDYTVGLFPFLPLCDPLIVGCFLDMTDTVKANVDAFVTNGSGAGLKDYHEEQKLLLVYKLGSIGKRELARDAGIDHALARVVTDFLNDRAFYKQLSKERKQPRAEPAEEVAETPAAPAPEEASLPAAKKAAASGGLVATAAAADIVSAKAADAAPPSPSAPSAADAASDAPAAEPPPKPAPRPKGRRHALTAEEQHALDEELLP